MVCTGIFKILSSILVSERLVAFQNLRTEIVFVPKNAIRKENDLPVAEVFQTEQSALSLVAYYYKPITGGVLLIAYH